jgi:hypothetical protein
MKCISSAIAVIALTFPVALAQNAPSQLDAFRPIDDLLRAPNDVRTVTGRPGPAYWQQRADFDISVTVDPETLSYTGELTVDYTNNSPDTLDEIYFLLDQNRFEHPAAARFMQRLDRVSRRGGIDPEAGVPAKWLRRWQQAENSEFGFRDITVEFDGAPVDFTIDGTLMRIDLPEELESGDSISLDIGFAANLVDADAFDARSGYELLEDGTPIIGLAHWFPRPAAYTDYRGWHVEPFIEQGEMTTEFGDYRVEITVPANYVVASTGMLDNPTEVLTETERQRLSSARRGYNAPVQIVTESEAEARRAETTDGMKTWVFKAISVRDFAFSASPAFLWDAMAVRQRSPANPRVMAMSYYPSEGLPVWQRFSTEAVAHTIEIYGEALFTYPYPQATAVNGVINSGMEYPMISFNGPRPHPENARDGVYTARDKYRVIGIVIHETGHFWMPMIVNSDERLYMWLDEGLNTFMEMRANLLWEPTFDEGIRRRAMIPYMTSQSDQPIMSTADSLIGRGQNAYVKPTTALFVLRELVLGREAFDRAFQAYARAWAFKRPTPTDFFRMMEQESGRDLDWFWRGWFFGTDHVDVSADAITVYDFADKDPEAIAAFEREEAGMGLLWKSFEARNEEEGIRYRTDRRTDLRDVYTENDRYTPLASEKASWEAELQSLDAADRAAYDRALREGLKLNVVTLVNRGGLPTPVPMEITYEDGSTERVELPVHIWRLTLDGTVRQLFAGPKAIASVRLDPDNLTVDADLANNVFPREVDRRPIRLRAPDTTRPESLMGDRMAARAAAEAEAAQESSAPTTAGTTVSSDSTEAAIDQETDPGSEEGVPAGAAPATAAEESGSGNDAAPATPEDAAPAEAAETDESDETGDEAGDPSD